MKTRFPSTLHCCLSGKGSALSLSAPRGCDDRHDGMRIDGVLVTDLLRVYRSQRTEAR